MEHLLWALPAISATLLFAIVPRRLSASAYFAAAALGTILVWLSNSLPVSALTTATAAILTAILIMFRVTNRKTTLTLMVAFAGVPLTMWWLYLPALAGWALFAAYRIRKHAGGDYVKFLAFETVSTVVGVGKLLRPDTDRLPLPGSSPSSGEVDASEAREQTGVGKVASEEYPFLLGFAIATGLVWAAAFTAGLLMR